jgi:hypothetical protein
MSNRMRLAGHVEYMREMRSAYGIFIGRPEGRRPLGRPRCRWEGNVRMNVRERV